MKQKYYQGSFLTKHGHTVEVTIYREADAAPAEVSELTFPADSPVVIEWDRRDKEAVLVGSVCSVSLISPGDRTYIGIYTVKPGDISVEVRRDGALYWAGTLDPEFYEEPYAYGSRYDVRLTFSDFGIMERGKFDLTGNVTAAALLSASLAYARLALPTDQRYISSKLTAGGRYMQLGDVAVRSENFYDEEGEAATWAEALAGMLQPLALRVEQRAGKVWVYDMNALSEITTADKRNPAIYWAGTDQTLGVDKAVNNVRITFSPYADSELFADDEAAFVPASEGQQRFPYYLTTPPYPVTPEWDQSGVSFIMQYPGALTTPATTQYAGNAFAIEPRLSAQEAVGLAYWFKSRSAVGGQDVTWKAGELSDLSAKAVWALPPVPLPAYDSGGALLRLSLPLVIDARYNPFEQADTVYDDEQESFVNKTALILIPFSAVIKNEVGDVLYHYVNIDEFNKTDTKTIGDFLSTAGRWEAGAAGVSSGMLAYYSGGEYGGRNEAAGWRTNRQLLSQKCGFVNANRKSFAMMDDGQYMAYPPTGGRLEVKIHTGYLSYSTVGDDIEIVTTETIRPLIRWLLYGLPALEIVRSDATLSEFPNEDIEYSGMINEEAKEDVEIDTICGTVESPNPCARGLMLEAASGQPLRALTRAGRTDSPEQLLIGTIYSQYAARHTVLSGTTAIGDNADTAPIWLYTEDAQEGKRFFRAGGVQNLIEDEDEAVWVEYTPDEYEPK